MEPFGSVLPPPPESSAAPDFDLLTALLGPSPSPNTAPTPPEQDPSQPNPMVSVLPGITLDEAEKAEMGRDIEQLLSMYEGVMKRRWKREAEIEDAYALVADRRGVGDYPGASQLCSEMLMATVDQASARLSNQLLSVKPTMRVEPLDSYVYRRPDLKSTMGEFAKATERFLDNYARRAIGIEDQIPHYAHRFTKVGTSVVHCSWQNQIKPVVKPGAQGQFQVFGKVEGKVIWTLISNRDTFVWPAWELDWQKAEWVGHRTWMSVQKLRAWAEQLRIDPEPLIAHRSGPGDAKSLQSTKAQGFELEQASNDKLTGLIPIWELWGKRAVGGVPFPVSFQCFYSNDTKSVLWIDLNRSNDGTHPYVPIRYKKVDQSAWGNGVGHETFMTHVADTAYRNIEIDNLMAAAFSIIVARAGSMADAMTERPQPGMRISSEDPEADLVIKSFAGDGGPISTIYQAMQENERRQMKATGLAAVLQGQGDPTLKSGGGTGSTIALINEADKKFGAIDQGVRIDIGKLYSKTLNLLAQWGSPQLYSRYASPEDVQYLLTLKTTQPGESIEDLLSICVEAPSATNNRELQKQNALVVWNFILQSSQTIMGLAQQIFPGMNPAGMIPYLVQWANVLSYSGQEVIDLHELPGMRELLPKIPMQPDPRDQMLNTLMQQLQQLQAELESLTGGAPPGGPEGGDASQGAPPAEVPV